MQLYRHHICKVSALLYCRHVQCIEAHFLCLDTQAGPWTYHIYRDLIPESIQIAIGSNEDIMETNTTLQSNTSLSVHVKDVKDQAFQGDMGDPQRDSFSLVAFTTTFEMALQ